MAALKESEIDALTIQMVIRGELDLSIFVPTNTTKLLNSFQCT